MTSEVAIANSGAVALAADSAVTISDQKIYNSALKVFALSKTEPVGVMIYGRADLMRVPWETLIKLFREEIVGDKYPTLKEYADRFIQFLASRVSAFDKDSQEIWMASNVAGYYKKIRNEFFEIVEDHFEKSGNINKSEAEKYFSDVVDKYYKEIKKLPLCKGISQKIYSNLRKDYNGVFKGFQIQVFENLKVTSTNSRKLSDIAASLLTREIFPDNHSGLVIAGYGDSEIFPSILTHIIDGGMSGFLKYKFSENQSHAIKGGSDCTIIPFAQADMVAVFMNGINPEINEFINFFVGNTFARIRELLELYGADQELIKKMASDTEHLTTKFFEALNRTVKDKCNAPVLNMVTALPKNELASMAEALVNLTAFKRKLTSEIESVGGPIDVAVISKGDGLVWVKRKHYFPPELNQHFFANYFRGATDDNT